VSRGPNLTCGLAFVIAFSAAAQARDFEMGGDSPYRYSFAAPAPNTAIHHAAVGALRTRRAKSHQAAKPLAKH
jgi:hypothetical protein